MRPSRTFSILPTRRGRGLGRAPWSSAALSSRLLAGLERQLSGEACGPSGYMIPVPDPGDRGQGEGDDGSADPMTTFRNDMHAAGGKTMLAPTTLGGMGAGAVNAPDTDYMARRFGMNPPAGAVEIRRDVERSDPCRGRDTAGARGPLGAGAIAPGGLAPVPYVDARAAGGARVGATLGGAWRRRPARHAPGARCLTWRPWRGRRARLWRTHSMPLADARSIVGL